VVVVEPATADCVSRALAAGRPVQVEGELATRAEMLSCGLASAAALRVLLRHEARAVTVSEDQLDDAVQALRSAGGPATTPSGATGLAGLLRAANDSALRDALELEAGSRVLLVITEGAGELG
jgi:diaminopropionate ammonia-lyase